MAALVYSSFIFSTEAERGPRRADSRFLSGLLRLDPMRSHCIGDEVEGSHFMVAREYLMPGRTEINPLPQSSWPGMSG
jgi:hypothetical protein